jgi:rhamnosyltransferase
VSSNSPQPSTAPAIPITVVLRSYNDAALLPRTLASLDEQTGVDITLLAFESASTDNSLEILRQHGCDHIEELAPGSYQSSRVLNAGVARASTKLVAFVNSDAILMHDRVLRQLADCLLAGDKRAGAFAKQIVRPDADALTRLEYDVAFENRDQLGADAAAWMTLVCSMIRREAWQETPFDEAVTFAEDAIWSHQVAAIGWSTHYVPAAIAEHSHDYSSRQRYVRAYGDAAALARIRSAPPSGNALSGFFLPFAKRCLRDSLRLVALGTPAAVLRLPFHRWPQLLGEWRGACDGWRHFHASPDDQEPNNREVTLQPLATSSR